MQTQLTWKSLRNTASAILVLLAFTVISQAQEAANQKIAAVKIKNFGQMDDRFYRGARPKTQEDFKDLAAMGITTVIDLTDNTPEERAAVEAAGMKYVNIPMVAKKYPTVEATSTFLKIANDPATGKFYLHCAGGRHRTGALGAVYRYQNYNWNFEQVYAEMKKFDFYTSWGHGAFKDFVKDYYDQMQTAKITAGASVSTPSGASGQPQDK